MKYRVEGEVAFSLNVKFNTSMTKEQVGRLTDQEFVDRFYNEVRQAQEKALERDDPRLTFLLEPDEIHELVEDRERLWNYRVHFSTTGIPDALIIEVQSPMLIEDIADLQDIVPVVEEQHNLHVADELYVEAIFALDPDYPQVPNKAERQV